MIKHGTAPYLECSSRGDKRFSALHARIMARDFRTIEEIYQSSKVFSRALNPNVDIDGHLLNWRDAKGLQAINQDEVSQLYEKLWLEYLLENPDLLPVLAQATGLSDLFGQTGHACQSTSLWRLREEYLRNGNLTAP